MPLIKVGKKNLSKLFHFRVVLDTLKSYKDGEDCSHKPYAQFPLLLTSLFCMVDLSQLMNQYSLFTYSIKFTECLLYTIAYAQNMVDATSTLMWLRIQLTV